MTIRQIVAEARQLSHRKRADLIDALVEDSIDPAIEEAWKQEARRRIAEIESGKVQGVPLEESLARVRRIIKRAR
jgi:putative addiction module component (TIGR02574 family)